MLMHVLRAMFLVILVAAQAAAVQIPLLDDHWLKGRADLSLTLQLQALREDSPLPGIDSLSEDDARDVSRETRLRRISHLLAETARSREVIEAISPWIDATELTPVVESTARWILSSALSMAGDGDGSRDQWHDQGIVDRWRLVGPFDNERGSGIDLRFGPEENHDSATLFPGKRQDIAWREAPAPGNGGQMELSWWVTPSSGACAYLSTWLTIEDQVAGALRVSSSGAYRIWLDGEEIGRNDSQRPLTFDQEVFPVRFSPGKHHLMVKSGVEQGRWAIRLRATDADGRAIPGLLCSRQPAEESSPGSGTGDHQLREGALEILMRNSKTGPDRDRLLAWLTEAVHRHDVSQHPERIHLESALEANPEDVRSWILRAKSWRAAASHAAERELNPWRTSLEKALSIEEGLHRVRIDLARYHLERFGNLDRCRRLLLPLIGEPEVLTEVAALMREIEKIDLGPLLARPWRELLHSRIASGPMVGIRMEKARELRNRGDIDGAENLLKGLLDYRSLPKSMNEMLDSIDFFRDRESTVLARRIQLAQFSPQRPQGWIDLADVHQWQNRFDEALMAIDRALLLRPDDESLHGRRGNLLNANGNRPAAIASFRRSLELDPNQPRIREYTDWLDRVRSGIEAEFRRPLEEIVQSALEKPLGEDPYRILLESRNVQVNGDGTAERYVQFLARIQNDSGIRQLDTYAIPYASGEQWVEVLNARVHRTDGTIEKARIRNREPRYRNDEYPVWSRSWIDLPPLEIGSIVEIEYRLEDLRPSFFGDYFGDDIVFGGVVPRDLTSYTIRYERDRELFFHPIGLPSEPIEALDDQWRTLTWEVASPDAIDPEPEMPPTSELVPRLQVSTYSDWDKFATWYHHLIRRQFESSEPIKEKVRELTAGLTDPIEKVQAIYDFVVTEIRYIAWEFGVHGFQPYSATTIFTRRFGDCKDKATLICTMLDEIGIEAFPVLIRGSRKRPEEDLTLPLVSHFNHCIAYLPGFGDDGLFLDGTASFHGSHQLPMMDRGADVLVVHEDRGEVRKIPWNHPREQGIAEERKVDVNIDGSAVIEINSEFEGDFAVSLRSSLELEGERKLRLERLLGSRMPGVEVEEVETSSFEDLSAPVEIRAKLRVPRYLEEESGNPVLPPLKDLFQSLDGIADSSSRPQREHDLLIGNPRSSKLTLEIEFPEGLKARVIPTSIDLAGPGVNFRFDSRVSKGRLILERQLELSQPRIAPGDYPVFKGIVDQIEQHLQQRVILEREGAPQ